MIDLNEGEEMNSKRSQYDASFKLEVARMVVDQGLSVMEVVESMRVGQTAVRRWVRRIVRLDKKHWQVFQHKNSQSMMLWLCAVQQQGGLELTAELGTLVNGSFGI